MNARILAWLAGGLVCAAASAAPGETAGAYGGGTSGDATEVTMDNADQDGDGVVNRTEARRIGIERFDAADANNDGVLDQQELSLVQTPGQMNAGPEVGELSTKPGSTPAAIAGEPAGAYGGATQVNAGPVNLKDADDDGNGVVDRQEARRVGIEQFEAADKNQDGVLDEAELAALETPAQSGGNTAPAAGAATTEGGGSTETKP